MLGFIGFVAMVLFIWGIVQLFKKEKRKSGIIKFVVGFMLFGAVVGMTDEDTDEIVADTDENTEEVEEVEEEKEKIEDTEPVEAESDESEEAEGENIEEAEEAEEMAETEDAGAVEEETESDLSLSQENAIKSAENYISFSAFSKTGLVDQLEFEGFPTDEAEFAVEYIEVDWMEQAVISAENYLDFTSFSRIGLIEQLIFEGFTEEQATYAVDEIGL